MFNEAQVKAAEDAAAAAVRAREAAEGKLAAAPYSDVAAAALTAAAQDAARKSANARELREAWEEQGAAHRSAASRGEREKAAAKQIGQAGRELTAAKRAVAAVAERAQAVLVELMDATSAYTALVEVHAGVLAGAGLDVRGGVTGGELGLMGARAQISGEWFEAADPGVVTSWVVSRVADARLPQMHHGRARMESASLFSGMRDRVDGLCAGLSQPKRLVFPPLPTLRNADQVAAMGSQSSGIFGRSA